MTSRTVALVMAIVPALLGAGGGALRADDGSKPAARAAKDAEASLLELGPLPTADAVVALARTVLLQDRETSLRFSGLLLTRGGHACARGLRTLVRSEDAGVRLAALRGVAQVRIRTSDGMDVVRAACSDADPNVRAAAYAAVGAVGDATDVPALLDALASQDADVVAAAFAALRVLSGAQLRCRAVVWRQWWKDVQQSAPARLEKALTAIERCRVAADVLDAEDVLARSAWIDLRGVTDRVATWLRSEDAALRREGYRVAADLRLGDLAGPLANALDCERDAAALRVGLASAQTLAVAVAAHGRVAMR